MLLLVANTLSVVYDDEGKVITEDEIKTEIQKHSIRLGHCCLGGGCIGGLYIATWPYMAEALSGLGNEGPYKAPLGTQVAAITIGVAIYILGDITGKHIDRTIAINRIKEERRAQKQYEDKKSFVPESKIILPLLIGRF